MKNKAEDPIFKSMLASADYDSVCSEVKENILSDIRNMPIPVKQGKTDRRIRLVVVVTSVIIGLCLLVGLFNIDWTSGYLIGQDWLQINFNPKLNWNLSLDHLNKIHLPDIKFTKFWYYLAGGLIAFWMYFILDRLLGRVFRFR